ncbi:MAG: bifunctional diguanylate cyclase/phosphodiesterase [Chloroflexota bacterium]|nr:bifunctional diguanylate cyclase/phosphodiesterase [Chloroflexota bacterium]
MPATMGNLTLRLLAGVVVALLAFAGLHRLALGVLTSNDLMAILVASAGAIAVATMALRRTIAPFVASQADLQVRYENALADALRDPLTGLGNHRAFHEELDRQAAAALRYEVPLALLLIDLDDFKDVNDTRGHAGGDRVLRAFGQLLGISLRRADRAFRVGGDEFALLLPHTDLEGARIVASRLLARALQPTTRAEDLTPVSFSGGVSALPALGLSPAQLYSQADTALYAAKRGGRTEIAIFDPAMTVAQSDSGSTSAALAEVIARGQLRAVFQPIVALASGQILGVEGLIRPIPPAPFEDPGALFAAAEASGRLTALDLVCIETIVKAARGLAPEQFLSLNLSPPTFEAAEFSSGALLAILARHGFPPERLVVELTERQQLHDPDRVRARIEACRRAGIRFAADDIGAGNAGLRLLSEIQFDILKVDLTLVQRSASEAASSAVIGSVVELASRTGALVVAEGIEHASQLAHLRALGIGAGQGYHLGRPGPLGEITSEPVEPVAVGVAAWRQAIGLSRVS